MSDIIPNVVVSMPSQLFTLARKFQAASNGKIFIGKIDTDPTLPENQIQVYLENEDGSHIPVPQPLIINQAGFPIYNGQIAKFVTVEGHSMAVYNSYGAQQHYYPNVLKYDPDRLRQEIAQPNSASIINFSQAPYINRNVGDILSDIPTNKYFGAKCDGITDDTKANQEALDWSAEYSRDIIFVGKSCITSRLTHKSGSRARHFGEIKPTRGFNDDVVIEINDDKWRDPYNDGITAIDTGDRVNIDGLRITPDDTIDAVGILGTDGVDPIISNVRTFNLRRGGIRIIKGYGWNISNISLIAPKDQNNSHKFSGVTHQTSDSFYSNIIASGYRTGMDIAGNANQLSKCHCWGMPSPNRETRNMMFGLNLSGSGNHVIQFYADSPKKLNHNDKASLDNGAIGFIISGYNNTLISPRNLSHELCGEKYGNVFYISGTENTIIAPVVESYDHIEDGGFFKFNKSATPLNNYVYGGNMQSIYLYPMEGNAFEPEISTPADYEFSYYSHNIIQKNVIGKLTITCNILDNSSGDDFFITLPNYLKGISGLASGSILNNLLPEIRKDSNLFSVEPYVNSGKIYFRRIFREGRADNIKNNMIFKDRAYFDVSFTAR